MGSTVVSTYKDKYKYLIIHSPQGVFRDNLQHCVGDFARVLVAQFAINKVEL